MQILNSNPKVERAAQGRDKDQERKIKQKELRWEFCCFFFFLGGGGVGGITGVGCGFKVSGLSKA